MPKFQVIVREEITHSVIVEAENKDEAACLADEYACRDYPDDDKSFKHAVDDVTFDVKDILELTDKPLILVG